MVYFHIATLYKTDNFNKNTQIKKLVELLWDELKKYDFDIMKIYLDVAE